MKHDLKCWPLPFDAVRRRVKTFELRVNDRDYKVGDVLHLREWSPVSKRYSGKYEDRTVTFILDEQQFGLKPGVIAMAIV